MEVHSRGNEQGPVVALVLALIVLGLGSLFLTWKSIARQRALVENNLFLSGGSIVRGVESNLMRIVRSMRGNRSVFPMFPALARDLFQELTESDDFLFMAIYDGNGKVLVTSADEGETPDMDFSRTSPSVLDSGQTWHFMSKLDGRELLISGLRIRPVISSILSGESISRPEGSPPLPPPDISRQEPPDPNAPSKSGRELSRRRLPGSDFHAYLVIGLNVDRHLQQFNQYRRAAMLQTGYVFLAAIVLWFLAFAYIRRRDQGKRLVRLEQFQNRLLDNMPDGLVNVGSDGRILAANGSAKMLLSPDGEPHELVGREWIELPPADNTPHETKTGKYQWQQHQHHGRLLEILTVPFPEGDDAAPELGQRLILIRDRTRIRSLEEDLNEARRLAAIGSLAAGVAHEVRNPLSSLRGFAQFFADKLKGQEPLNSYATTMVQEADRLNRVVTDLLYLAKPRALAPEHVELETIADSLTKLMRFDMKNKGIEPKFEFETETVWADPDALKQVLLNLIANSLDALPCKEDEQQSITITSRAGEDGVWISVEDSGTGMDDKTREQALEPFFTGKHTGTGLGLAIVHNIMRGHRGQVHIESAPEQGTSVRLFFPNPAETDT